MDLKWLDLWWTSSNWGMSPNDCEVFRHMAQVALAGALPAPVGRNPVVSGVNLVQDFIHHSILPLLFRRCIMWMFQSLTKMYLLQQSV